jgi:hypothetical protein
MITRAVKLAARRIRQSAASARDTLVLANEEHKDVASENEGARHDP